MASEAGDMLQLEPAGLLHVKLMVCV